MIQMHMTYPHRTGFVEKGGASQEAADIMKPTAKTLQLRILREWDGKPNWTTDEMAMWLGEDKGAVRPRFTELKLLGKIVKTGYRRKNRSGMSATVWETKTD